MVKEIALTTARKSRLFFFSSLFVMILFLVCRIFFHIYYHNSFSHLSVWELCKVYFGGAYFDLSALAVQNALFILWMCIPVKEGWQKKHTTIGIVLFIAFNTLGIALSIFDIAFFDFSHKRLTADILDFGGKQDNFLTLIPGFLKNYWYLAVFFVLMLLVIRRFARTYIARFPATTAKHNAGTIAGAFITLILWMGLMLLNFRGWLALIPISITDAGKFASAQNVPLVLNTPFTFAKSVGQHTLPELNYFPQQECDGIFSPVHQVNKAAGRSFQKRNIVVIALESFSKEFTAGAGSSTSYTPFLDSLAKESLYFSNAWSNGKQSIQGIPAILAAIPSLSNEPFTNSIYAGNNYTGLAGILRNENYYTAFFHGANNGSFNFDAFAAQAGYHDYYGRTEYHNEEDYDGNWGIWDEAFLQYAGKKMSEFPQPFHTAIFTLNSHHPYQIPAKYESRFKGDGNNPLTKAVQYTDNSLRLFFESICKKPWFANTVFVFSADHTGMSSHPFYSNLAGQYQIPVFIFDPSHKIAPKTETATLSQSDIAPTLLHLLGYRKPFYALGNDIYEKSSFAVYYTNGYYTMAQSTYLYVFDGKAGVSLYNFAVDSLLQRNLLRLPEDSVSTGMERTLKAYLQQYTETIRSNRMTVQK